MGWARNLWGKTKAEIVKITQYIDLKPQTTAPTASLGRVYMDASYKLRVCEDGTNYTTVTAS
jgi:hypothetical protein